MATPAPHRRHGACGVPSVPVSPQAQPSEEPAGGERDRTGPSQFDLLAEAHGQAEAHEVLPLLGRADAVVGQLLHRHPVDALGMADSVVHLQGRSEQRVRRNEWSD